MTVVDLLKSVLASRLRDTYDTYQADMYNTARNYVIKDPFDPHRPHHAPAADYLTLRPEARNKAPPP